MKTNKKANQLLLPLLFVILLAGCKVEAQYETIEGSNNESSSYQEIVEELAENVQQPISENGDRMSGSQNEQVQGSELEETYSLENPVVGTDPAFKPGQFGRMPPQRGGQQNLPQGDFTSSENPSLSTINFFVSLNESEFSIDGYTIFASSGPFGSTYLIDMDGNLVQEWQIKGSPPKMLPDGSLIGKENPQSNPGDGLIDPQGSSSMLQVNWYGQEIWSIDDSLLENIGNFSSMQHHDYQREGNPVGYYSPGQDFVENGDTLILAYEIKLVPEISSLPIQDDVIYEVDWDGNLTGFFWSASDHFDEFGFDQEAIDAIYTGVTYDDEAGYINFMHFNSMSLLGENHWYDEGDTRFHPENIIISSRSANIVAIISRETGVIVWKIGPDFNESTPEFILGQFMGQHHAHLIPEGLPGEGNILVFDNGGRSGFGGPTGYPKYTRGFSRVLEFDPISMEIIWQYGSETGEEFFYSHIISSAQRLPNGNTLITDGANARIFEVTTENEVVWEFIFESGSDRAASIYRAYRVPPEWVPGNSLDYTPWEELLSP